MTRINDIQKVDPHQPEDERDSIGADIDPRIDLRNRPLARLKVCRYCMNQV